MHVEWIKINITSTQIKTLMCRSSISSVYKIKQLQKIRQISMLRLKNRTNFILQTIYRRRSNLNTLKKRASQIINPYWLKIKLCWFSSWASKMSARSSPCTRSLKIISIWSNISERSTKREELRVLQVSPRKIIRKCRTNLP
jgi:hypothetical protein